MADCYSGVDHALRRHVLRCGLSRCGTRQWRSIYHFRLEIHRQAQGSQRHRVASALAPSLCACETAWTLIAHATTAKLPPAPCCGTVARKLNTRPRETLDWKTPAYILEAIVSLTH